MRMVMLLYRCILLTILVLLASCRTRKLDVKEEKSSVQESMQLLRNVSQNNFEFNQSQQDYNLSSFGFGSNISLQSKDSTKPARITEYRNGKPYRSLEVQNGSYRENKVIKDSATSKVERELSQKYNNLRMLYSAQNIKIKELETKQEYIKTEAAKLANNFKYLLWVLLAIALIWIGQSTGLFSLFKRFLKRV